MKSITILLILAACCLTAVAQTVTSDVVVPVPVPAPDKFTALLAKLTDIVIGITGTLTLLLAWYAKNKETLKKINEVLIKAISTHGTDALRSEIKDAAGSVGVEPDLKALVIKHAPTPPVAEDPFKAPTVTIPALQPVAQPEAKL